MIWPYLTHLLILIGIYVLLSVSLNLAFGFTGLLNLGHAALFGIGAYASALLTQAGVPFLLAFLLAGVFASIGGFLLILATRKFKGHYLALITLAFNFVVFSLMLNLDKLTRGPRGIPGIMKPMIFGLKISSNFSYLIFVLVICLILISLIYLITKSPFGRLLKAVRDDETALSVLGKNTFNLKIKSMMISAFVAGIAGSLFAHYISFIDPYSFTMAEVMIIFSIVIIGGVASLKGSIVATFVILLIPEALRFLALPSSLIGPLRQIIYALVLFFILLYRPKGFFGEIDLE